MTIEELDKQPKQEGTKIKVRQGNSEHYIYLYDPGTGTTERRPMGPDWHLGGTRE